MEDRRKLYRLNSLSGYKVASHYADVRGWKVIDADNRTIGKVEDLLINKFEERVVYIEVEADSQLIESRHTSIDGQNAHDENHLLIPIGEVVIDPKDKFVLCNKIHFETFSRIRRFKKGTDINREYEVNSFHSYYPEEERYNERDEESFYRRSPFSSRE